MAISKGALYGVITVVAAGLIITGIVIGLDPFTPQFTLTLENTDINKGTVTWLPNNPSTTPEGETIYNTVLITFKMGTVVNLTVTAKPGYAFAGWAGANASMVVKVTAGQIYTLTIAGNMSIRATWSCPAC